MASGSDNPRQKAGGISIHAVDIANGVPANGLMVRLYRLDEEKQELASGTCDQTGLLRHPVSDGEAVDRGLYEVQFSVGDFYRAKGAVLPDPSFLETEIFHFCIDKMNEHFHLPFKFTPWGYSLFRGGA